MYLSLSIILALAGPLSAGMEVMGNRYYHTLFQITTAFNFLLHTRVHLQVST